MRGLKQLLMDMEAYNRFLLSIGSNISASENLCSARASLEDYFPDIFFSDIITSEPIDCPKKDPFLNCLASVISPRSFSEVQTILKKLEAIAGRNPESKREGIIPLDIDILVWNGETLKPEDMERDYVRKALSTILSEE